MIDGIVNIIRREVQRMTGMVAQPRVGIVDGYNPVTYSCRVRLQPGNQITGWLPILTMWGGNQWGMFCPPTPGDVVKVLFQEGGKEAGVVLGRFYSTKTQPLAVNSGEFWVVHKSGSFVKMTNDTKVLINSVGDLDITVGGNANVTVTGNASVTVTGSTTVNSTGNVAVSSNGSTTITGTSGMTLNGPAGITLNGNTTINGTLGTASGAHGSGNATINGTLIATGEGTFNGGHTVSAHTHTQGSDSHGDTERATDSPTG